MERAVSALRAVPAICKTCGRAKATAKDNIRWLSGARIDSRIGFSGICWGGLVTSEFGGLLPSEMTADADTLRTVIVELRERLSDRSCAVAELATIVLEKGPPIGGVE